MDKVGDTIFALSSGGLPAGVAVVRISGPAAFSAARCLAGALPRPREATLRTIRQRNGLILDHGLLLVFPGPASFTGEDCVEIQIHGGKAVVAALLGELGAIDGCRLAQHGEFSRRALENGKLDLVEIEGLADLLAAETEMQRRLAIEQSAGGLSKIYVGWADRLTRARALIEAELDFADEDDVPGSVSKQIWADIAAIEAEIDTHLKGASFAEIVRDGLKVAIAGPPNAGKSSLLNAIAGREVAIVTEVAGTTRDVLQVDIDLDGYAVRFFDTAGLRETSDVVERKGIRRALETIAEADVILSLVEIGNVPQIDFVGYSGKVIRIGTKADLHPEKLPGYDFCISSLDGSGLMDLRRLLAADLHHRSDGLTLALPSRLRHATLLHETLRFIRQAIAGIDQDLDIRAEHLRLAGQSLGEITGHVGVEDLLDVIFSEFCIGK